MLLYVQRKVRGKWKNHHPKPVTHMEAHLILCEGKDDYGDCGWRFVKEQDSTGNGPQQYFLHSIRSAMSSFARCFR